MSRSLARGENDEGKFIRITILTMAEANPIHVHNYLKGAQYPAHKDTLIECAYEEGASQEIIDMLEGVPDREYQNLADLAQEFSADVGEDD